MNKERILALADALAAASDESFGMELWWSGALVRDEMTIAAVVAQHSEKDPPPCGTAACIAGWATFLAPRSEWYTFDSRNGSLVDWSATAQHWLGLEHHIADSLFTMESSDYCLHEATREDAVKVLYNLSKTGMVNWDVVIEQRLMPSDDEMSQI